MDKIKMLVYRWQAKRWARRNFYGICPTFISAREMHFGRFPVMSGNPCRVIGAVVRKDGRFDAKMLTTSDMIEDAWNQGLVLVVMK